MYSLTKIRLVAFILIFCSFRAYTLTLSENTITQQLEEAAVVADVFVESFEIAHSSKFWAQYQTISQIENILKKPNEGPFSDLNAGSRIQIVGPGGEYDKIGVYLSGLPRLYSNRRYRVHLKINDSQLSVTGFERGVIPLDSPTRKFTRNRTDGSNGEGTGAFLYWDDSYFPIPYTISLPTFRNQVDFVKAIDTSFQTWHNVEGSRVEFLPFGCTLSDRNENDGISSIVLVTKEWLYDPAAIAVTRNFYLADNSSRAGLIMDSDILLNGVHHQFTTTHETGKHDVQNIVTHEIGHFLGLGHETDPVDPEATMYAVAAPNELVKRTLKSSDLAGIHAAYGGVGKKFSELKNSCNVSSEKYSCAAVHENENSLTTIWIKFLVFLFSSLSVCVLIGRASRFIF